MIEYLTPRTFLFITQAILFSVLLFVFYIYYRTFLRKYLKYWLVSIGALSLGYFIKSVLPFIQGEFTSANWKITAETFLQAVQYLFILFLVFGVYNAKTNQAVPKVVFVTCFIAISLLSTTATLLFAFEPSQAFNHFYLTNSLPSFIFGCTFLALASYLLFEKKKLLFKPNPHVLRCYFWFSVPNTFFYFHRCFNRDLVSSIRAVFLIF
jgi:hypothetical protein